MKRIFLVIGIIANCICTSSFAAIFNVPSEYSTIQAAIGASVDGDEVVIAPGIYTGAGNRDLDFRGKAITVRGTDPNNPEIIAATIIDCNGGNNVQDRHRGFFFHSGEGADSKVEGLTITRGIAPLVSFKSPSGQTISSSGGGAIACISSSPTLSRLMIVNNSVSPNGYGGGIFCSLSDIVLEKCTIMNNGISTMMYPIYGGGICAFSSTITAKECAIVHNGALAGIATRGGGGGGLYSMESSVFLNNCIIAENAAPIAGGIVFRLQQNSGIFSITNCTVSGNYGRGIAIAMLSSDLREIITVRNSIVWGNGGDEISGLFDLKNNQISCRYSTIKGGWVGEGNIDTDPCFIKAGCWDVNNTPYSPADDKWIKGDYHLRPESLCIDAGDPNYIGEPNATDLDGLPRIRGGRVDIGAHEFNDKPIADAGEDSTFYARLNETAKVVLDGSGSEDADGDALVYKWTWVVGADTYDANGVSPTIELPVGVHTVQLVVNDGLVDSLPDDVNVTVIAAVKGDLCVMPSTINRRSNEKNILATIRLSAGISKGNIDCNEPLTLYPGGIEASRQWVIPCNERGRRSVSIFAFFDKDDLMTALPQNGITPLKVAGKLKNGQYFYGCDTVRIIDLKWKW